MERERRDRPVYWSRFTYGGWFRGRRPRAGEVPGSEPPERYSGRPPRLTEGGLRLIEGVGYSTVRFAREAPGVLRTSAPNLASLPAAEPHLAF